MAKIAVLIGNGLSVALSRELSLPNITKRFLNRLPVEQKALVEHYISDNNDRGDFERCIAHVEKLHDVLH